MASNNLSSMCRTAMLGSSADGHNGVSAKTAIPNNNLALSRVQLHQRAEVCGRVQTLVAIGASSGGPVAIQRVLQHLDLKDNAGLIAQHMPAHFLPAFADRLNREVSPPVLMAEHGMRLKKGHCYLAPGGYHLTVWRSCEEVVCRLNAGAPVNGHRPSVDTLFESIARTTDRTIAIVLTGMGDDGAQGMLGIKQRGGITLAQDEHTSSVWGMPKRAMDLGAVDHVLPINAIGPALAQLL